VHGVSGSTAESFLGCPPPHRAADDEDKRSEFLQCDDADPAGDETGRTLEAFRWGNYTSGSPRNALWLLLLPFGVINATQFMIYRPRTATILAKAAYTVASALLGLLGLALTLLLVFGVTVIATDLVAWQALDQRSGWILAASALAPVLMLAFLIWLGREDITKGETVGNPREVIDDQQAEAPDDPPTDFRTPGFYAGNIRTPHLWVLHVAGSLAFLWWILGGALDLSFVWGPLAFKLSFEWGLLVVVPAAATVLILGDPAGSAAVNRRAPNPLWRRVLTLLVGVVAAFNAVGFGKSVLDVYAADPVALSTRTLPGIDEAALLLMGSAVLILVLFAVMCLLLALMTRTEESKDRPATFSRYARGNLPSMVAAVATFLAVGLTAAVVLVARATLNGLAGLDLLPDLRRVEVPQIVERAAYAWGLTIGVILVLVVGFVVAAKVLPHRRYHDRVREMFDSAAPNPTNGLVRIARAMFVARLKNHLVAVLAGFSIFGLLLSLAAGLEMSRFTWQSGIPGSWLDLLDPCDPETAGCRPSNAFGWLSDGDGVVGLFAHVMWVGGVWGLGLGALALLALGVWARYSPEVLRKWSIGWDVIAFWPRSAHPGVPPPYSLRVVGDLADRIRWHLRTCVKRMDGSSAPKASYVVLCGHSQGSLISFAALLALNDADRRRVGFVSFGSQLRLIFPRAFPSYVNYASAKWLRSGLQDKDRNDKVRDRWVNLFRETDPLAGPVLSWDRCGEGEKATSLRFEDWQGGARTADEVDSETGLRKCGQDWRLLDPRVTELNGAKPKLRKHSDFFGDPAWPDAVIAVSPIKGN